MPKFVGLNAIWTKDGNGLLNHAWNYLLLVIQVVLAVEVLILKNGGTKKNLEKIGSPPAEKMNEKISLFPTDTKVSVPNQC